MNNRYVFLGLLAFLPFAVFADDGAQSLYVMRPILHAEQEQAELCLEFDHALDAVGGTARAVAALHVESDGKPVPLSGRDISLGDNQLCLLSLKHSRAYRLMLGALRGAKGEKLLRPYSLSFTVPSRPPSLAFMSQDTRDGLALWRDTPVLHSVNSPKVMVDLYRITDPAKMLEAWSQRLQTALAPSESLYFARHNGVLIAKKDVTPEPVLDASVASALDFQETDKKDFSPGLYLIAANAPEDPALKEKTDKEDQDKETALSPNAAIWLLRSNLRLHALGDARNLTVTSETADGTGLAKNIRLLAFDRDQKLLAEAQSDAKGLTTFALPADHPAQTVVGLDDAGNVAFLDLAGTAVANPVLPPLIARLTLDQPIIVPDDKITFGFALHDVRNHPVALKNSMLHMLRADRSLYDSQPVTLDAGGMAKLSLVAPASSGIWHAVWKQEDGSQLAEADFRVSRNPAAPELGLSADRDSLDADGSVTLTLRSRTPAGAPAPYVAGHVELTWVQAEYFSSAWKDFHFDDGKKIDAVPVTIAHFMTDKNGQASVRVALLASHQVPALRQAQLRAVGDASGDVRDLDPVILPVKPTETVLGISPRAAKGFFPENSVAHFDVVALDGNGAPQTPENLTYQIYEEGRSFEWLQSEGHWDYKPQPRRRRIGGGGLNFADNGRAVVEGSVTSGTYRLDITTTDGALRASTDFSAGWNSGDRDKPDAAPLRLSVPFLPNGVPVKVGFSLPRRAAVTISVADDLLRQVLHEVYPAGAVTVALPPINDGARRFLVRVEAHFDDKTALGQMTVPAENEAVKSSSYGQPKFPETIRPITETPDRILKSAPPQVIAPKQSMAVSGKPILLGPEEFYDAPALLASYLRHDPFISKDLAARLDVLRLTQDTVMTTGLMTEAGLQALRHAELLRLLARQNMDGGFAPIPGGASDLASTAAAVRALAGLNDAVVRPAEEQAVRWLRHRLENTWFDEKERAARAAAYAALAAAGKLDVASLHYFSDTGADKALPSLACAEIAYAFAAINDKAAAGFWIDQARNNSPYKPAMPFDSLPILADNDLAALDELRSALGNASKNAMAKQDDAATVGDFLRAIWRFEERAGNWALAVGKEEKTLHGFFTFNPADKTVALRNPSSNHALYAVQLGAMRTASTDKTAVRRRLYTLDGDEAKNPQPGVTYVVMLEGAWREGQEALALHDNPEPVLQPLTCALAAPDGNGFLGWLAAKTPMPGKACERGAGGMDILLVRDDNAAAWRIAYLAKAGNTAKTPIRFPVLETINPDDTGDRH